jgi:hypothetical protein
MADSGGSLLPSVPASVAPITAQYGGATYNASLTQEDERFSLEIGEKIVDYNEIFPGLFTVRDISNNFKQYDISNGEIKKKYLLNDFDPLFRNEIKKFDIQTQKRKLEKAGLPINLPTTKSTMAPETGATKTAETRGIQSKKTNEILSTEGQYEDNDRKLEDSVENEIKEPTESAESTKKSTIDDDVVNKLREILRGDSEYQAVLALLGDAKPSELRANIIFNPAYKIIADLLKQIVRFKVEQYALGLKQVRGEGESKAANVVGPSGEVVTVSGEMVNPVTANVSSAGKDAKKKAGEGSDEKAGEGSDEKAGEGSDAKAGEVADAKAGEVVDAKAGEVADAKAGEVADAKAGKVDKSKIPLAPGSIYSEKNMENITKLLNNPVSQSRTATETGTDSATAPGTETTTAPVNESATVPGSGSRTATVPNPIQGGVKSRKASRVLRKLKTMKKSKKHTVPLL